MLDLEQRKQAERFPDLDIKSFSGPFDLLFTLLEKQKIDIFDISLSELTDQYMDFITANLESDMELASDFLLMAATLLHLKSRLILPKAPGEQEEADPQTEFILRLLVYKRCKLIAATLAERMTEHRYALRRQPATAAELGVTTVIKLEPCADYKHEYFLAAAQRLQNKNEARFQDLRQRMDNIVSKEKFSLVRSLQNIWNKLKRYKRFTFNELFGPKEPRLLRITGFMALLELLKAAKVEVSQEQPFAELKIELNDSVDASALVEGGNDADEAFSSWLSEANIQEVDVY